MIDKISDTEFEYEYPDGDRNNQIPLEFNNDGLEIDEFDTLPWEDIKTAYKVIFDNELSAEKEVIQSII